MVVVGQAITDPISGPSFDFTFTIGPELDNIAHAVWLYYTIFCTGPRTHSSALSQFWSCCENLKVH